MRVLPSPSKMKLFLSFILFFLQDVRALGLTYSMCLPYHRSLLSQVWNLKIVHGKASLGAAFVCRAHEPISRPVLLRRAPFLAIRSKVTQRYGGPPSIASSSLKAGLKPHAFSCSPLAPPPASPSPEAQWVAWCQSLSPNLPRLAGWLLWG